MLSLTENWNYITKGHVCICRDEGEESRPENTEQENPVQFSMYRLCSQNCFKMS